MDILLEQRDRAQVEYNTARKAWNEFRTEAKDWTTFTNRIHRTPEEDELVKKV